MSIRFLLLALVALTLGSPALSQIQKAPLSPRSRAEHQVGLAQVGVDYSRPGVKGRQIFGGLEPYGKVWRTGANSSSKISFDRAVSVGGEEVPEGTYGLYTIPGEKEWTFILSRDSALWGAGGYDPANDQLRIQVQPQELKDLQETLLISFSGFHANGADLTICWEHTRIAVPVFVDSDAEVLAQIDARVRNATGEISPQTYFDAAMFLYEKEAELDEAAAWMAAAVEGNSGAFWYRYYQGELALAMGNKKLAKAAAGDALARARKARGGDFGYVAKCEMLLEKL